jgi:hypothetical protein
MRSLSRTLSIAVVLSLSGIARAELPPANTVPHDPTRPEKAAKPKIEHGFEAATWHMSQPQLLVLVPETQPAEGGLSVERQVMGRPALVAYFFADGFGLSRVQILFKDSLDGPADALGIFSEVDAELTKKYGLPTQSSEYWTVKPNKMTDQARQQSLVSGGLQIANTWAGAKTWVILGVGATAMQDAPGTSLTFLSTDAPMTREFLQQAGVSHKTLKADP